jgi:hypothetical protein
MTITDLTSSTPSEKFMRSRNLHCGLALDLPDLSLSLSRWKETSPFNRKKEPC